MVIKKSKTSRLPVFRYILSTIVVVSLLSGLIYFESEKVFAKSEIEELRDQLSVLKQQSTEIIKTRNRREEFFFFQIMMNEPVLFSNNLIRIFNEFSSKMKECGRIVRFNADKNNGALTYRIEGRISKGKQTDFRSICDNISEEGSVGSLETAVNGEGVFVVKGELEL